jgi:hypothetical protein
MIINLFGMSISYEELFRTLKFEIENLAGMLIPDHLSQAVSDGNYILTELRNSIEEWCEMLDTADIDAGNFKSLLFDERENFKMMALRKAGLTILEMEDFRDQVFKLIYSSVITMVKQS